MNVNINIELKSLNIEPLAMAKYFYERGITSHLFIQKLIYFAFLKGLKNGLLLFTEKFQAWKYGAVLLSVQRVMSDKEVDPGTRLAKILPVQSKEVIALLEEIYHEYKDWEVWDLVDKSHKGPWKEVRGELDDWESSNKEIDLPKLIKFAINGYLEDERILGKKDSLTIKEIQTGVQEIKSILENTSKSERKAEFFRKLSQLSPWELAEIHDTERIMDSLKKVRIKH